VKEAMGIGSLYWILEAGGQRDAEGNTFQQRKRYCWYPWCLCDRTVFFFQEDVMRISRFVSMLLIAAMLGLSTMAAQEKSKERGGKDISGFRGEFLTQLTDVEKKFVDLAQAIPAEKYGWRPGEGVRSVSEVLAHVAGANYMLPSLVGVKQPAGLNRDMEKTVTEKSKAIETLKQSFSHIRSAIMNTTNSDLEKPAKFFGEETTVRGIYFYAGLHMHEHLGQLIAYARVNSIVPPWTAAEQAVQKKGLN
jgi:uncharacterized damage-inducible protein DinB